MKKESNPKPSNRALNQQKSLSKEIDLFLARLIVSSSRLKKNLDCMCKYDVILLI